MMKLKIHVAETFRGKYLSQMQTSILLLLLPALCLAYTWEQVLGYYITQFFLSVRIVNQGHQGGLPATANREQSGAQHREP